MYRRIIVAAAAILLLVGCQKENTAGKRLEESVAAGRAEKAETITVSNVFRETAYLLPDGFSFVGSVIPEIDGTDGVLTVLGERTEGEAREYRFFSFDGDGDLTAEQSCTVGEGEQITAGAFDSGRFAVSFASSAGRDRTGRAEIRDRDSGDTLFAFSYEEIPGDGFEPSWIGFTPDGGLWLANWEQVLFPGASAGETVSVRAERWISWAFSGPDGEVWVCTNTGDWSLARADRETRRFIPAVSLMPESRFAALSNDSACYCDGPAGLYAVAEEDGEAVLILDTLNSGLNAADTDISRQGETVDEPLMVLDRDTVLFLRRGEDGRAYPAMYRRGEDLVVDAAHTILLAHAEPLPAAVRAEIASVNRSRQDVRIVVSDYTVYRNAEDPEGGTRRLVTDLLTGLVSPDMIAASPASEEVRQLVRREMCADLGPFLDAGLGRDAVFGCVLRGFSDGEGRIWGLPAEFYLDTLAVPAEFSDLSEEGWSAEDLCVFLDGVPEGTPLLERLMPEYAFDLVFGQYGCASFLDFETGETRFSSRGFEGFLERAARSFSGGWSTEPAIRRVRLSFDGGRGLFALDTAFPGREAVAVGYPERGSEVTADAVFLILSDADNPTLAWETLTGFLCSGSAFPEGIPTLRERFRSMTKELQDRIFLLYDDGRSEVRIAEGETEDFVLRKPGIARRLTDETRAEFEAYFDRTGVVPELRITDAVRNIVREEISAFAAGHGTAADCAARIDSRAGLWLSEGR